MGYQRVTTPLFNPTLDKDGLLIPYDYDKYLSKGIITPIMMAVPKYKFFAINSSIAVSNMTFYEFTFEDSYENCLFHGNVHEY